MHVPVDKAKQAAVVTIQCLDVRTVEPRKLMVKKVYSVEGRTTIITFAPLVTSPLFQSCTAFSMVLYSY